MLKTTTIALGDQSYKLTTVNVLINNEEMEVIPAFTQYSLNRGNISKTMEIVDTSKVLPTVFAFTKPGIFRKEGVKLLDFSGTEIPPELDDKVLVYLDKADNLNLFEILSDPLKVEMVECENVADAYQRVSTSFALSQVPQKRDWIGLCEVTTSENIFAQIREFAMKNKMSGTTAQAYFGLKLTVADLRKGALTLVTPLKDGVSVRTVEEATKLYDTLKEILGAKPATQTRYVKGLNTSINVNSVDQVVDALWEFSQKDIKEIKDAPSDSKEGTLVAFIERHIQKMSSREAA